MTVLRLGNGPRLILQALPLPGSEFDLPDDCNGAQSSLIGCENADLLRSKPKRKS
jgi:hypothetical protein